MKKTYIFACFFANNTDINTTKMRFVIAATHVVTHFKLSALSQMVSASRNL